MSGNVPDEDIERLEQNLLLAFPELVGVVSHNQQVLCLAEEVGEFIQAYRRNAGLARKSGSFDDMAKELADVIIVTQLTAYRLGIDLDYYVAQNMKNITTRGYRNEP